MVVTLLAVMYYWGHCLLTGNDLSPHSFSKATYNLRRIESYIPCRTQGTVWSMFSNKLYLYFISLYTVLQNFFKKPVKGNRLKRSYFMSKCFPLCPLSKLEENE